MNVSYEYQQGTYSKDTCSLKFSDVNFWSDFDHYLKEKPGLFIGQILMKTD